MAAAATAPSLSSLSSATRRRQGSTAVIHSVHLARLPFHQTLTSARVRFIPPRAVQKTKDAKAANRPPPPLSDAEKATLNYGLELGLWEIFSPSNGESGGDLKAKLDEAKKLMAKYGDAYMATTITVYAISFAACYLLVTAAVNVQGLLQYGGFTVDETGAEVGTFALANFINTATSPIQFVATVVLTPIVAGWLGKKTEGRGKEKDDAGDGSK